MKFKDMWKFHPSCVEKSLKYFSESVKLATDPEY